MKKVHIIYKTHLDIGFTDFAENVEQQYLNNYIDNAIKIAFEMNTTHKKFVWTTGSWLIYRYVQSKDEHELTQLREAVEKGYIKWHGIPFTTHTELMDSTLLNYGLSYSQKLDAMFNQKTIAAKMTDVPGHTIGIIKHLVKAGIKYLHIGVNPASKMPHVPKAFLWRDQEGREIIVNYSNVYGESLCIDGLDDILTFCHAGDNCGYLDRQTIEKEYARVQETYGECEVYGSTLDAYAKAAWEQRHILPVVTEEIGDTWIHGVATDPIKVANYKTLLKLKDQWIKNGDIVKDSQQYCGFMDNLLLVCEHTWGMDLKKYLPDYKHYAKEDFMRARAIDDVENCVTDKYGFITPFTYNEVNKRGYKVIEQSWKEQREYIQKAVSSLDIAQQQEANKACQTDNSMNTEGFDSIIPGKEYVFMENQIVFGADGSIIKLVDGKEQEIAGTDNPIGRFLYEKIGVADYEAWFGKYMDTKENYRWCISDFSKPGYEFVDDAYERECFYPFGIDLCYQQKKTHVLAVMKLAMEPRACEVYGCPREINIAYRIYAHKIEINLSWKKKDISRIPEASWLIIAPKIDNKYQYKLNKLDSEVSCYNVVRDGAKKLHCTEYVTYDGADKHMKITPIHTPLVGIGSSNFLQFDNVVGDLDRGFYFNIHNNVWGTNFPMWFGEDISVDYVFEWESK
ncbi:DUF5054 domain-containing protein [Vallitaleaceae bacterium 9-2]